MTNMNHEDSGIVDLQRLRDGGATTTALPLGPAAPARARRGRSPRSAWALATVVVTLAASSMVLAATLGRSPKDGPAPVATFHGQTGVTAPAGETRIGPSMEHVPSQVIEGPTPEDASDTRPDRRVRASAVSPTRGAVATPAVPRSREGDEASGGEVGFEPAPDEGAALDEDIDALLDRALAGNTSDAETAEPALPELPSRGDVSGAMRSVTGPVRACAPDASGVVTVRAVVDGPSGRVTGVTVGGGDLDAAARACIAREVKGAGFPRFERQGFQVSFPYVL